MIDDFTFGKGECFLYLVKYLRKEENKKYAKSVNKFIMNFNAYLRDIEKTKFKYNYMVLLLRDFVTDIKNKNYPKEIETNLLNIIKTRYKECLTAQYL